MDRPGAVKRGGWGGGGSATVTNADECKIISLEKLLNENCPRGRLKTRGNI